MKRICLGAVGLLLLLLAALAGAALYTAQQPPEGIPVFAYHKIGADGDTYSVPPALFEAQLQYLQSEGYTTVSLLEIAKAKKGKLALPPKPAVITFDDGYADNYATALPLLEKYGMKGTVFMVVNDIGRKGYLTLEQLKEMEARQIEIGSHTANHLPLASLPAEKKEEEIAISKLLLEWKGLKTVFFLAYPNGSYDTDCGGLLKQNEYLGALTGDSGLNTFDTDPYYMKRVNVPQPRLGLPEFKLRLLWAQMHAKFGK